MLRIVPPRRARVFRMDAAQVQASMHALPRWTLSADWKSISRSFSFPDFALALAFANTVGALAEEENHHPDIALSWGNATITLSTHSVGGVTEKDFILAQKIDALS
jgi:4a-hydroxytetrahydrobiopterin dehydratase